MQTMGANLVAVGPGDTGRKGTRGRRLPAALKVKRDEALVSDRNRGLTWALVAERHGVSQTQARNIYKAWRQHRTLPAPGRDPVEWLWDTLDRYDSIQSQLAVIAETGDNSAARVGALNAQMNAMLRQTQLMVVAGLLPRDLGASFASVEVHQLMARFIEILERREADPDLVRELLELTRA